MKKIQKTKKILEAVVVIVVALTFMTPSSALITNITPEPKDTKQFVKTTSQQLVTNEVLPMSVMDMGSALPEASDETTNIKPPGIVLQIQASSAIGFGVFTVAFDSLSMDPTTQTLSWELTSPISIVDRKTNAVVATLNSADLAFCGCSQIELSFQMEAGDSETVVVIRTAQLSFPTIGCDVAEGRATAAFSLSDLDGDYALLLGLGTPGTGIYLAQFNGAVPGGTMFTHLVGLIFVGSGGTGSASQSYPGSGYLPIDADVNDMSVQVAFSLTANDRVTASTLFDINPDPDACWLIGIPMLTANH